MTTTHDRQAATEAAGRSLDGGGGGGRHGKSLKLRCKRIQTDTRLVTCVSITLVSVWPTLPPSVLPQTVFIQRSKRGRERYEIVMSTSNGSRYLKSIDSAAGGAGPKAVA